MVTDTDPKPALTEPKPEPTDPRESAAFKAVTKQIAERDKQLADMQVRIDANDADAKKREQADLESRGKYDEAIKIERDAREAADRKVIDVEAREKLGIVKSNFMIAATAAGMNNALTIDGALSAYLAVEDRGEPKAWLDKLKTEPGNAALFGTPPPGGIPPADPGAGAGSGGGAYTKAQLDEMSKSDKEEDRLAAIAYKERWYNEHNNSFAGLLD